MALTVSEEVISIKIEGLEEVKQGYRDVIRSQGKLEDSTGDADKAVAKSSEGFSKLEKRLVALGSASQIAQAGVLALQRAIGTLSAPVQLAADFERDFAKITTLLDDTGDGFSGLREQFLELSRRTPQDMADLLRSGYDAISSGFDESQVIPFLEQASAAAVAGSVTMTQAVDILSSAVSAYSESGVDAAQVSDVFFATVRGGKTTMDELSQSFGRGAALASMGVSIEELGAAIAALTLKGIPTAEAMTAINAAVKALSNESGGAVKALREMGVEAGVSTMTGKGFAFALEQVNRATGGSAEGLSKLKLDMEAQKAITLLLSQDMGEFNARLADNQKAAGNTADANLKMAATAENAFLMFGKLRDDVLRDIGMRLLPDVNRLLERLTQVIEENGARASDVAVRLGRALINFGQFVLENGPRIITTLERVFSVVAISKFIQQVNLARGAVVGLGSSMAGGFGASLSSALRSPTVATMAISAAVALGGLIGDTIGDAMTESVRRQQERLDAQVAADLAKLELELAARGFDGVQEKREIDRQLSRGDLLTDARNVGRDATTGELDFSGARDQAFTAAEAIKRFGVEGAREMAIGMATVFAEASDEFAARVEYQQRRLQDLRSELERDRRNLAAQPLLQDSIDDTERRIAAIDAKLPKLQRRRDELFEISAGMAGKIQVPETKSEAVLSGTGDAEERDVASAQKAADARRRIQEAIHIADLKARGDFLAAEMAALQNSQRRQVEAARKHNIDVTSLEETHRIQRDALREQFAAEEAQKIADAAEQALQAEAAREIRSLEQRGEFDEARLRQLEEAHRQEFAERRTAGEDASKIIHDQAAEAQRLREEIAQRRREQAFDEYSQGVEGAMRLHELRGETGAAQLLELDLFKQMELERHRDNNEALLAIEEHYADRRREIIYQENIAKADAVKQYGEQASGSVLGIMGAHSRLAQARMRSAKTDFEAGKISKKAYEDQARAAFEFERKQIIAQGVLSGFLGLVDSAKALSAFANLNFAQGALFTASAAKHFTNASMSGEMAQHAYSANVAGLRGGGAGGAGGAGGGGLPPSVGGAATSAGPRDLEERDRAPTIQFGDIVLSDVPGLLSDEGVRQLGARVAGSVVEEVNRQSGIPGGFRMEG